MADSAGSESSHPSDDAGTRAALVVAVDTYLDDDLRQLRAPADDAATFGEVLADPDLGGFEVTTVINGTGHEVRLAIAEFLTDRRPSDVALVYLSCHGLVDVRRRLYFATRDTIKDRLSATAIESHWLLDQLEECRARRQVVVLDCCFSGAFAHGAKGVDDLGLGEFLGQGRGRVVLTASRGTEYSFEGSPVAGAAVPGSVFTNALVAGILTGAADRDNDGYVSVDDAYAYAFDEMRVSGAEQTPQRWLYGAEGEILLSRTPSDVAATRVPAPAPAAADRSPRPGPTRASQTRGRTRRFRIAAAVLAALGVLLAAAVWISLRGEDDSGSDFRTGVAKSGEFSSSGPWNLQIADDGEQSRGCVVKVTNKDSGEVVTYPPADDSGPAAEYDDALWQIADTGDFRWTANEEGCVVLPVPGSYNAEPSTLNATGFTPQFEHGDTEAFHADGLIEVSVENAHDSWPCIILVVDVANGEPIARKEAKEQEPTVELDRGSADMVYVQNPGCDIHVAAAG